MAITATVLTAGSPWRFLSDEPKFPLIKPTERLRESDVDIENPFQHITQNISKVKFDLAASRAADKTVAEAAARVQKRLGPLAVVGGRRYNAYR